MRYPPSSDSGAIRSTPAGVDEVLSRASRDVEFRRRLLATPHAALAEAGLPVPARVRLRCIERGADVDALIVLPDFVGQFPAVGPVPDAGAAARQPA